MPFIKSFSFFYQELKAEILYIENRFVKIKYKINSYLFLNTPLKYSYTSYFLYFISKHPLNF